MKINKIIAVVVALMVLTSCGKKKYFVVQGELANLDNGTVVMTYYADGGLKRVSVGAEEGKFVLRGESAEPTLCVMEMGDVHLANVVAQNGEKIELKGDAFDPYNLKVSGNGTSKQISKFVSENAEALVAGNGAEINRLLAEYVANHRSDRASVALLVSYFQTPGYEALADSLVTLIAPEVRTAALMQNFGAVLATQLTKHTAREVGPMSFYERKDTVISYSPTASSYTVFAFLGEGKLMRDSVTPMLREMNELPARKMQVVEISMATDSASWKRATAADSAKWHQVWAPATAAKVEMHNLAVPRVPFFILADSAGMQVLRSSSVKAVRAEIDRRLPIKH